MPCFLAVFLLYLLSRFDFECLLEGVVVEALYMCAAVWSYGNGYFLLWIRMLKSDYLIVYLIDLLLYKLYEMIGLDDRDFADKVNWVHQRIYLVTLCLSLISLDTVNLINSYHHSFYRLLLLRPVCQYVSSFDSKIFIPADYLHHQNIVQLFKHPDIHFEHHTIFTRRVVIF